MLRQPRLPSRPIPLADFKIDLSRTVPSDIPSNNATPSMRSDWKTSISNQIEEEGGQDRANIEELASIQIHGPLWKGKYGTLYAGGWRNVQVSVSFRDLLKTDRRKLIQERDCFKLAQNKRVLELYGTCIDFVRLTGNFVTQIFMCNLRAYYEDFVPKTTTAKFMVQLTEGLAFVHSKDILLRDICPENILILNNENLVISHFGGAVMISPNGSHQDTFRIGSPEYSAIETLQCNPGTNFYSFTKSSDVFSLGTILFEIWTSNSFMAFPNELIQFNDAEFYIEVLTKGRPFARRDNATHKMIMCTKNGKDFEVLQERLLVNLKSSCPVGFEQSFVELFGSMLNNQRIARISAENILSSEAFKKLAELFDTCDISEDVALETLPNINYAVEDCYTVEDKLSIRNVLPTFFGFSKLYKKLGVTGNRHCQTSHVAEKDDKDIYNPPPGSSSTKIPHASTNPYDLYPLSNMPPTKSAAPVTISNVEVANNGKGYQRSELDITSEYTTSIFIKDCLSELDNDFMDL